MVPEIWSAQDRIFVVILGHFLPFYLPNSLKNENLKKMEKTPGDIIILHKGTKNHDHRLYCSWDMTYEIWLINCYFLFWAILVRITLPPPNSPKNETFKKMKKSPVDIIILQKCTKNHDNMLCCSWDMACDRCNCYFSFWAIFCPFYPITVQKMKISKKLKKCLKISSFYTSAPKIMIICYTVWDMAHDACNYFPFLTIFLPF